MSVCLFVRALKGKRLELSLPKSAHGRISKCTYPKVKRSKVKSYLTLGNLHSPGVSLHVDTTAHFSIIVIGLTAGLS